MLLISLEVLSVLLMLRKDLYAAFQFYISRKNYNEITRTFFSFKYHSCRNNQTTTTGHTITQRDYWSRNPETKERK